MEREWYNFLLQRSRNYNIPIDSLKANPELLYEYHKMKGGCDDDNDEYYKNIGKTIIKVLEGDVDGEVLNSLIRSLESV